MKIEKKIYIVIILIILIFILNKCPLMQHKKKEYYNTLKNNYLLINDKFYLNDNNILTKSSKNSIKVMVKKDINHMVIMQLDSKYSKHLYLKHIVNKLGHSRFIFSTYELADKQNYLFNYSAVPGKAAYFLENNNVYIMIHNNLLYGTKNKNDAATFAFT